MKNTTVISNEGTCYIEITHRSSDPTAWYVTQGKKYLWFKKKKFTRMFIDKKQALEFAEEMKRECEGLL